jgi:iron complex transport system ATP-binding protein
LADFAIDLSAVTTGYGARAVIRDVTLQVERSAMVGVIGPNGSGKSTLLRLLSGVVPSWSGHVRVEGRPLESYTPRELSRRVAVVPQETHIEFPFTVMEVVLLGRTPHLSALAFESGHDLAVAQRAMERTDVAHLAARRITELSGGERQRVILARALAQEPSILVLDEPSAFLDIRHQVEIYDLLRDLQGEGMTVVTVLHDLNLAGLYCDRLVLLADGAVAHAGPPADVLRYQTLTQVYGTEVYVILNEITQRMNVLPLSRSFREQLRREFKKDAER